MRLLHCNGRSQAPLRIAFPAASRPFGRWWMIGIMAAAAIAAATPASLSAPAAANNADPAIFVVHDADTTVYLFGTFHALDGKTEWFNDQVKDAFEQSDELVLETLLPEGPPAALKAPPAPAVALRMPVASSASFLATTR